MLDEERIDVMEADSETAEDSSPEPTEDQETQGESSSEDVNTETPETEDDIDNDSYEEGQTIPYERFKKHRDQYNEVKQENENIKQELDDVRGALRHPKVVRALLESEGKSEREIQQILKEEGLESGEDKQSEQTEQEILAKCVDGLDLTKQASWLTAIMRISKHYSSQAVDPVAKRLSEKEMYQKVLDMEADAKKIAKDVYGIEYGQAGKDENNPNTAVGKISKYLKKYPEHSGLGHSTLLKLAMSEEGFKTAKQKGIDHEKKRQESLRKVAMEGETEYSQSATPNADWSTSAILAWSRKYNK
jgi:hypothetical protein